MNNESGVTLVRAEFSDCEEIHRMQVKAFSDLLEKYKDHDTNPGAESVEKTKWRFGFPATAFYFIVAEGVKVGVIRIIDHKDDRLKKISPIFIMKEYRNRGYAQAAIKEAERVHGSTGWSLDTILQEAGNCHLYEKLGYRKTGNAKVINDKMTVISYVKDQ
ncbi:MAG: GNAT family N-acetyltransferase [Clostridia bacterium]|nr:GNAT family N-acetyltransferase [Clostridia bacterium]